VLEVEESRRSVALCSEFAGERRLAALPRPQQGDRGGSPEPTKNGLEKLTSDDHSLHFGNAIPKMQGNLPLANFRPFAAVSRLGLTA
jgi:hypothetical protein